MRIGILGGTFDPPHIGHLEFGRAAIEALNLDELIFLPANRNPQKRLKTTPAKQRLEMVQRMVLGEPKMAVSDIEISRGGLSFTIDTLMELQAVRPGDYWLLLGADALRGLSHWKNPDKILRMARLAVALRPPLSESELMLRITPDVKERLDIVPMKQIDISATDIRDRISKRHGLIAPFLAPGVLQYINQNGLYRS